MKRDRITGEDAPDLGLVEPPRCRVDRVVALDDGLVELPERVVVEEGAAAFVLPGTRHGRNAQRRVHLRRTIAAARKAIAVTEEASLGLADHAGEGFDL